MTALHSKLRDFKYRRAGNYLNDAENNVFPWILILPKYLECMQISICTVATVYELPSNPYLHYT
jgi:hypothetical protein